MAMQISQTHEAEVHNTATAESVQRLVDWIRQILDEAGVKPARPSTAHAMTASRAEANAQRQSPSANRRSELPVAIWQARCTHGHPVTVMIFATKSRFLLRAVATDNSDFVNTQLVIDVNEPRWAELLRLKTSRERELLSSASWWLKRLPQMLAVDRISSRSLVLRIDKHQLRQLFRRDSIISGE